jgi:hypothetical protein
MSNGDLAPKQTQTPVMIVSEQALFTIAHFEIKRSVEPELETSGIRVEPGRLPRSFCIPDES